jgi:hypothetical protein
MRAPRTWGPVLSELQSFSREVRKLVFHVKSPDLLKLATNSTLEKNIQCGPNAGRVCRLIYCVSAGQQVPCWAQVLPLEFLRVMDATDTSSAP